MTSAPPRYNPFSAVIPRSSLQHCDLVEDSIWDSIHFTAGQTATRNNTQLFRNVGPASGKTYVHSNMHMPERLDPPDQMAWKRIIFTFSSLCDPVDVARFTEDCCWIYWCGKKRYAWNVMASMQTGRAPLNPVRICSYCQGVFSNSANCPTCGASQFSLGDLGSGESTGKQFFQDYAEPNLILTQQSFSVEFEMNPITLIGDFKMWCHLEGHRMRGCQ